MKEVMKNKKGLTLVELLAVIIVVTIILLIAVPNVINQVEKTREKAFYISVRNLTDKLKPINLYENKDYCIYNYSQDKVNQTELIKKMYVLAHMEDDKIVYSVYARSNKDKIIDTYDISKLSDSQPDKWEEEKKENSSYSFYALALYLKYYTGENFTSSDITNFKICEFEK